MSRSREKQNHKKRKKNEQNTHPNASIANAFIIYGVIPVLLFIAYSFIDERTFGLLSDMRVAPVPMSDHHQGMDKPAASVSKQHSNQAEAEDAEPTPRTKKNEQRKSSNRRDKDDAPSSQSETTHSTNPNTSSLDDKIDKLREEQRQDSNDIYKTLRMAESLLERDLQIHDGGTVQSEAIHTFHTAIDLIAKKRDQVLEQGGDVRLGRTDINEELMLEMEERSLQGLLVGAYCSLSRQYFMANMFKKSVEATNEALKLEPRCLQALNSRASSLVILGKYDEAGSDYSQVLDIDTDHTMVEIYSGMVRALTAKEDSIPDGWARLLGIMTPLISQYETSLARIGTDNHNDAQMRHLQIALLVRLKTMHFAMFAYHEFKSGDNELAWHHLTMASEYKMTLLPPYNAHAEAQNIGIIKNIFVKGFWPAGVGSTSRKPIFIVGFPRSGSTLLESILNAHPQIVGTGEDSVFNGMLGEIRDGIIQASVNGSLRSVVDSFVKTVDGVTRDRWVELERNSDSEEEKISVEPEYFVDKMLSNYMNIGFIHMLYPDALIFHIAREPMDTLYSAYKHEFPPGKLDYTSNFESLAHMYRGYREIMDHWDEHLPGRITHIRYEDIVENKNEMTKKIIAATGLKWDNDVLNFHKKNHAVNTHSTLQVRKDVYADSLQTWKKHEIHLRPLVKLLGKHVVHKYETRL